MHPGRVIQDSDDEDDALSDVATSIDPLQEQEQEQHDDDYGNAEGQAEEHEERPSEKEVEYTTERAITGSQLGVNFDDFLQSQPQMTAGLSSSQQRREERWIPTESGNESIGATMSEIGRAQRLLVDDVTPLDYPLLPSMDQSADPLLSTYQSSDGAGGMKRPQSVVDAVSGEDQDTGYWSEQQAKRCKISENGNGEDEVVELPQNGNEHQLQDLLQQSAAMDERSHGNPGPDDPEKTASINDNEASVTASYNYFDSSLKLREYTEVSTVPIASEERDELVETIRRTPGRSKSMQMAPVDSPHDTEPFSSLISPHVKRAKSDMPVKGVSPRASIDTPDELSLPVTVEAPLAQKKKRGRKKKQLAEDGTDGEPDELNADPTHGIPDEPKKRGRGRPRKVQVEGVQSPKPQFDEDLVMAVAHETIADPDQPSKFEEDSRFVMHDEKPEYDTFDPAKADVGLPQEQYIPRPSRSRAQPIENYESPDSISGLPTEKTKKRKIKRGKTTSIMIKKSYESDVEDDVIWIDEKPVKEPFKAKDETAAAVAQRPDAVANDFAEDNQCDIKDIKPTDAIEDPTKREAIDPARSDEPPGPKKRGRKRKKTAELVIADPPAQQDISEDAETNEHTTPQITPNNVIPPITTEEGQSTTHEDTIQKPAEPHDITPEPDIPTPQTPTAKPHDPTACTSQNTKTKGPDKHSPITSTSKVPYRVGLSRRARIAPLLKIVRK
ncbi:hypothetical protein DTO021D3_7336 [Paecilomyces variotii]|nr:hypothetical protein DTO032I3_7594 [Paecilomyces variotii]KAJ9275822.1 hypothetical protein DTO021D3_7336 [Paecilomyces variotii]KAJ9340491.1 hypothetical protein DTO027B6_6934 [Paecilomyces variotii]KAJ9376108.1 hypothetical protein DTO032I4_8747 [Paecilomyces variotii]